MRNIFLILIFIPIIISIKWPWEWDWDFDFDWDSFINNLKSIIPTFITDMKSKIKDFMNKAEAEKQQIMENLNSEISALQQKIKDDIAQKKEDFENELKNLMEKGTEVAKYLSYKVCDIAQMDYEDCRNNKKQLLLNLLNAVKENFGQCSVVIQQITKLTESAELNLKYILFLINAITENPDAIEKGKTQVVYDILNCLEEKLEEYWPIVSANLAKGEISINVKEDITNLLLSSYSKLVDMIQYDELDGNIEKANNITGLIPAAITKKVHQGIFKLLKRINEFGAGFYNISANMALNIITNPGNLDVSADTEFQWINDDNKGIKIKLHSNYMLREKGASSLQAVVFESPLVSLRANSAKEGGTSNTFVGITLYDKDGNEIVVKDFPIEDLRPEIFFKKRLFGAMEKCLYYNEEKDTIENTGILSAIVNFDGEEYIKCIPKHLSSFTIGSYENSSEVANNEKEKNYTTVIIIASVVGAVGLLVGGFFIYRCVRRRKNFY